MIRFEPDTWRDALLRPIAMAAPDSGVYIEIIAPDFRFIFALLLAGLLFIFLIFGRKKINHSKPTLTIFLVTVVAFAPWLFTSGNGRYFLAFLLAIGPVCVALIYLLPMTRGFRLTLTMCLLVIQSFAVYQSDSTRSWGMSQWRDSPYFEINLPIDMIERPGTYVTLSSISYSLIAPLFPASSSWINIAAAPTDGEKTQEGRRIHKILSSKNSLILIVPSIPEFSTLQGLPDHKAIKSFNLMLAEHRLALSEPYQCRLVESSSINSMHIVQIRKSNEKIFNKAGFWACALRYPMAIPAERVDIEKSKFDKVFEKIESICPRFFRPGEAKTKIINDGELRQYAESDMKVYVMHDRLVMYKYIRSFSPELIGTIDEVMSGKATVDCDKLRGRSGLPWERTL